MLMYTVFFFNGCTDQGPGPYGDSVIIGKVQVEAYNDDFSQLLQTYDAMDQDVFIVYGDDVGYGNKVKTSYDGTFEFPYLSPGKYKIYVYSEDSSLSLVNDDIPVIVEVEIVAKRQFSDLGTITIMNNNVECNSGVKGKVFYINFDANWTDTLDAYYRSGESVYMRRLGSSIDHNAITIHDGSYEFGGLCPGNYEVWIYSQDSTNQSPSGEIPVIDTFSIVKNNEVVVLPDLVRID